LSDVVGKEGTIAPAQIVREVPKLNAGVMFGFTVTVKAVPFAHWLPDGVNVYVADVVLLTTAGLHVPIIPFVDDEGRTGTL
jgi:NADH:ubiquinone oxidoreductase subunit 4 (subunit M)